MRTGEMQQLIRRGIDVEQKSGWLKGELRKVARRMGKNPDGDAVTKVVGMVKDYVEQIPALLEAVERAAQQRGCSHVVAPLLGIAEDYFFAPDDLIPDRKGLGGLIDDAYLAIGCMRLASKQAAAQTGRPLLADDLAGLAIIHAIVREVMGPQIVAQLDQRIAGSMRQDWFTQLVSAMQAMPVGAFPLRTDTPHPIYGNASTQEIVDVQMGSLGIYPSWQV